MFGIFIPALRTTLVTCLLCGLAYPMAVTAIGQLLLPYQANGSLVRGPDGTILGSRLIGQNWTGPQWFHGRLSATTANDPEDPTKTIAAPYNAAASAAFNLGPTSRALAERIINDRKAAEAQQPELGRELLPSDMLTASGSGLDPEISPAYAALQVPRIVAARGLTRDQVSALVTRHTKGRALGIFGEPRVNVLELNLALESMAPSPAKLP